MGLSDGNEGRGLFPLLRNVEHLRGGCRIDAGVVSYEGH
jgi:hypothetical protein